MAQRVLVVDDDPDLQDLLGEVLKSCVPGLEVTAASDGRSALAFIEREPFDLVLLDIHMPRMDGLEALRRIKAIAPRLPVLMLTGSDSATASEALALGAFGYLPKPMDLVYVEHLIAHALGASPLAVHA